METSRTERVKSTVSRLHVVNSLVQRVARATGTVIRVTPTNDPTRIRIQITGFGAVDVAVTRVRGIIASLSGIGSVDASASASRSIGVQFDGVGSLDALASAIRSEAASVAGVGTVDVATGRFRTVQIAGTAVGTCTITGTVNTAASVTLEVSGIGSIDVTPSAIRSATAYVEGFAATDMILSRQRGLSATVLGIATHTALASATKSETATISSLNSITILSARIRSLAVLHQGLGSATLLTSATKTDTLSVSGIATISVAETRLRSTAASIAAVAATSSTASRIRSITTAYNGVASTSITATVNSSAFATFLATGIGSVTVSPSATKTFPVAFTGIGSLAVAESRLRSILAAHGGIGAANLAPSLLRSLSASISGVGTVTVTDSRVRSALASILGVGVSNVSASAIRSVTNAINGVGAVTAIESRIRAIAAGHGGIATASVVSSLLRSLSASISGLGTVTVTESRVRTALASILGVGASTISASAVRSITNSINGVGSVTVSDSRLRTIISAVSGVATTVAMASMRRSFAASISGIAQLALTATVEGGAILSRAAVNYWSAKDTSGTTVTNGGLGGAGSMSLVNGAAFLDWSATYGDYVDLTPGSSNRIWSPDSAANSITSNMSALVLAALYDWTKAASEQWLIGKSDASVDHAFDLQMYASKPRWQSASTGGAYGYTVTSDGTAVTWADGEFHGVKIRASYTGGPKNMYFYTSDDGVNWTQFGSKLTGAHNAIVDSGADVELGSGNNGVTKRGEGRYYYAALFNDDTETNKVWEFDASLANQSGYTDAVSGDAINFDRATSGPSLKLVTRPQFSLDTNDYLDAADHSSLDVGSGVDFFAAAYVRMPNNPASSATVLAKKQDLSSSAGYSIYINTSGQPVGVVADGTNTVTITGTALTLNSATMICLQRKGGNIELIQVNAAGTLSATPVADTTGDLSNALTLRVGRLSNTGTSYWEGGVFFAIQETAHNLTAAEVATLKTECDTNLGGRIGE